MILIYKYSKHRTSLGPFNATLFQVHVFYEYITSTS